MTKYYSNYNNGIDPIEESRLKKISINDFEDFEDFIHKECSLYQRNKNGQLAAKPVDPLSQLFRVFQIKRRFASVSICTCLSIFIRQSD